MMCDAHVRDGHGEERVFIFRNGCLVDLGVAHQFLHRVLGVETVAAEYLHSVRCHLPNKESARPDHIPGARLGAISARSRQIISTARA